MAGKTTSSDLGIDLSRGSPAALYRWLLACMLFGRPIQQSVAAETYRALIRAGLTSPRRFADWQREPLRRVLTDAGYARFDYQMTDTLHEAMADIVERFGSVSALVKEASSRDELVERLESVKGVGPKVTEIFLRDVPASVIASRGRR